MRLEKEVLLDFKDVLIRPKRSTLTSRKEVDLHRKYTFKHSKEEFFGIPILASNMDHVGTMEMGKALYQFGMGVCLHKFYSVDQLEQFYKSNKSFKSWYSLGITDTDYQKWQELKTRLDIFTPKYICIDVANGYQEVFVDFIKKFRNENPEQVIMAGNVVTGDMSEALILAGADVVKVGIGPGSVCTTRKMTGVGYPQLSAIIDCADAAHGLNAHVCADGGCTVPGDVAKAFGAGADFVMLGGMFAGHDECSGEITEKTIQKVTIAKSWDDPIVKQYDDAYGDSTGVHVNRLLPSNKSQMKFYGMSSDTAMEKHYGGVNKYRASEGKTVLVPYKGPVENTVQEILGGLRSTCTYVGAKQLKELSKRTTFVMVTQQINNVFTGKEV